MASIWLAAFKYLTLSGLNWKRRIIEVSYEITVQVMCDPIRLPRHVTVAFFCAGDTLCVGWKKKASHKAEPSALPFCSPCSPFVDTQQPSSQSLTELPSSTPSGQPQAFAEPTGESHVRRRKESGGEEGAQAQPRQSWECPRHHLAPASPLRGMALRPRESKPHALASIARSRSSRNLNPSLQSSTRCFYSPRSRLKTF